MISQEECERIGLLKMMAAFVDGEGSIGIYRSLRKGKYTYAQHLQIINTDIRLIEWLVENFGGSFPKVMNMGDNHKDAYHWTINGYNSYKILKKIRPYLLLKQEQADNAIELYKKVSKWKYGGINPLPDHKRKLSEELYQRNRELNMRGMDEEKLDVAPKLVRKITTLEEFE